MLDSLSHRPLEYATSSIFPKGAKKPTNGAVSDKKGNFEVDKVAPGIYKLVAEFIGYKPHSLSNIIAGKDKPVNDVNDIMGL